MIMQISNCITLTELGTGIEYKMDNPGQYVIMHVVILPCAGSKFSKLCINNYNFPQENGIKKANYCTG